MTIHTDAAGSSEVRSEDLGLYRRELTGYCYRMLGSVFEADDAVQETMVRAWRGLDSFEQIRRGSVRRLRSLSPSRASGRKLLDRNEHERRIGRE